MIQGVLDQFIDKDRQKIDPEQVPLLDQRSNTTIKDLHLVSTDLDRLGANIHQLKGNLLIFQKQITLSDIKIVTDWVAGCNVKMVLYSGLKTTVTVTFFRVFSLFSLGFLLVGTFA